MAAVSWFGLLGRAVAAYAIYRVIRCLTSFISVFVLPRFGIRGDLKKYGSWAVVTGATDGIGKCYAKEFAKAGLNLVLISRSKDKLEATKKEISAEFKVDVKTVSFDFSNTSGYEVISDVIGELDVGLLVNNVGMSYSYPEYTHAYDVKNMENLININCVSAVKMTKIVLKGMLDRKRGAIVSVTSFCSAFPFPFLNVYSASKIFVDYFTKALCYEHPNSGVDFQVVCPMYVATKMSGMRPSVMTPTSSTYARSAVGTIGLTPFTHGYWFHEITATIANYVPDIIKMHLTCNSMKSIRGRALKRLERKKE